MTTHNEIATVNERMRRQYGPWPLDEAISSICWKLRPLEDDGDADRAREFLAGLAVGESAKFYSTRTFEYGSGVGGRMVCHVARISSEFWKVA